MRQGDLSELLKIGANYQVYDPATTQTAPNGRLSRQPFANNIIPASRLDPVAQKLMQFWPAANQAGTRDGQNNHYNSAPTVTRAWVHLARFDHSFSDSHRMFLRINKDQWTSLENQVFSNTARGYDQARRNSGIAADDVYMLSSSFLINVRYGLSYQEWTERRASSGTDLKALGFSDQLVSLVTDRERATLPRLSVGSLTQLGSWSTGDGVGTATNHSISGTITQLKGDHNLRYGAEFRVYQQNRTQNPEELSPDLSFSSTYTRGPLDNSAAPPVGGELAAFLLGIPGGSMGRVTSSAETDRHLGLYIQDDYKVSPRLTLSLGLRYEVESPITERFDRSVAHFAFNAASPVEAQARANYALAPIPELPVAQFSAKGGLTYVNRDGNPRSYWSGEKNNFMPRVGCAWQLRPQTVLRGGYGWFFDSIGVINTAGIQTGFSQSTPIQPSLDNGLTFRANTANPFPDGLIPPLGAAGGLATNLGQSISFYPEHRLNPYSQRWSLSAQQLLPGQVLAEASYVGNRATRLPIDRDLNVTPAQYFSQLPYRDTQTINYLSQNFANPFAGTNPIYGQNIQRASLLRPYPQFGSVTVTDPVGYSWYHSLQVRAEKRLSHGYTFQLSYTWSKTMEALSFLNPSDPLPYESLSAMDRTHRLVVSGIWEIPVGRGRQYGASMPAVAEFLAGGWQLNAVVQRQSGPPLGFGDVWTLFTGDPDNIVLPKSQRSVDRWFNTDAGFNRNSSQQLASNIRVSALRFGGIRGDGQARWDFSAIKSFRVTEGLKTQFRAECLNAWNHPNLFTPNTTPTSTTFGMITSQDVPRIWRLALRVLF